MYLEFGELEVVNKKRDFILKTSSKDTLSLCRCRKCKGTGLDKVYYSTDGKWTSWDATSYCDYCKGVGYLNPNEFDKTLYKCCICNGEGFILNPMHGTNNPFPKDCPNCKGFGFVDWIENLFGKKE